MNRDATFGTRSPLERLRFAHVAYAFAAVCALHVAEELPRFITCARDFPEVYGGEMTAATFRAGDELFVAYVSSCLLLRLGGEPIGVVTALSVPFRAVSNAVKHITMTLTSNTDSPGALTGAGLYLALAVRLFDRAAGEGLPSVQRVVTVMVIGLGVQFGVLSLGRLV